MLCKCWWAAFHTTHPIYIQDAICYSYTTVRVWYRSYYMNTRQSRVRVLITMISYEYTWYNWLVPCQRNWNQHFFQAPALFCKTRSIYSIRAVGKSIQLTVLLEYINLCHSNKLIVPHAAIHVLYLYTKYWIRTEARTMKACEQLGGIIIASSLALSNHSL